MSVCLAHIKPPRAEWGNIKMVIRSRGQCSCHINHVEVAWMVKKAQLPEWVVVGGEIYGFPWTHTLVVRTIPFVVYNS